MRTPHAWKQQCAAVTICVLDFTAM